MIPHSTTTNRSHLAINLVSMTGHFATPEGDSYQLHKLRKNVAGMSAQGTPFVTWEGAATARDYPQHTRDAAVLEKFECENGHPIVMIDDNIPERPLEIKLRYRLTKFHTHIAVFWNHSGLYIVFAKVLTDDRGLRFVGTLVPYTLKKSSAALPPNETA